MRKWLKSIFNYLSYEAERGMALMAAIFVVLICMVIGGSFSLVVRNEMVQSTATDDSERAMYVAESGIWDVLYQYSKLGGCTMCFPFDNNDNLPACTPVGKTAVGMWTVGDSPAKKGSMPDCMAIMGDYYASPAVQPNCWAYDERLLPNQDPPFEPAKSDPYHPLAVYPSDTVLLNPVNWDVRTGTPDPDANLPTPNDYIGFGTGTVYNNVDIPTWTSGGGSAISDTALYQVGFFTNCNDLDHACSIPPCDTRSIQNFSLVSIGVVKSAQGGAVRRAVKVDVTSPFLYSGVIDEYMDLTALVTHHNKGPIHINGLCADPVNRLDCDAFYWFDMTGALPAMTGSYDSIISVSYPEDPLNPDFPDNLDPLVRLILCALFPDVCDIVWVHLPVTVDIPSINWDQFEDRMTALQAELMTATVYMLKCNDSNEGTWSGLSGGDAQYNGYAKGCMVSGPAQDHDTGDPLTSGTDETPVVGGLGINFGLDWGNEMWRCQLQDVSWRNDEWKDSMGFADGRIHNCRSQRDKYTWNTSYFFDVCAYSVVSDSCTNSAAHTVDGSMISTATWYFKLDISDIFGGCNLLDPSDWINCVTTYTESTAFTFVGAHRLGVSPCDGGIIDFYCPGNPPGFSPHSSYVKDQDQRVFFFDGDITFGMAPPTHSCGPTAPISFSWSTVGAFMEDLMDYACVKWGGWWIIPPIIFGIPHFHVGDMEISGEVLVNGSVHIQDRFRIAGGALYAVGDVTKQGSSGISITFNLIDFITFLLSCIFAACADYCVPVINVCLFHDIIGALIAAVFPSLAGDQELISPDTGMYVDGGNGNLRNSGLLYTRGSFFYRGSDGIGVLTILQWIQSLANIGILDVLGKMGFGIGVNEDPARLTRGGAIVARDDVYIGGEDSLDLHIPDQEIGFVFAGRNLQIREIGSRCHPGPIFGGCTERTFGSVSLLNETWGDYPTEYARSIVYGGHSVASKDIECILNPKDTIDPVKDREPDDTGPLMPGSEYDALKALTCELSGLAELPGHLAGWEWPQWNIKGNIFAGKVVSMYWNQLRVAQDWSVTPEVLMRNYVKNVGGIPMNWMEVPAPNLP